jgi:hypothetical protein
MWNGFLIAYAWIINYGPRIIIGVIVFIVGILLLRLLNKWEKRHGVDSIMQSLFGFRYKSRRDVINIEILIDSDA